MKQDDRDAFESLADAHCDVANQLLAHLSVKRIFFCPTEYCASRADPTVVDSTYLRTVGAKLDPQFEVMWTGSCVIPKEITVESLQELRGVIRRKPLLWDNLNANDYDSRRVFLGPFFGRPWQIINLVSGVLLNPNCEFSANFVPLHTLSAWAKSGSSYDVHLATQQALEAWLPYFKDGKPKMQEVTNAELELLVDMFYLPYNYGKRATQFVDDFVWLQQNSPTSMSSLPCPRFATFSFLTASPFTFCFPSHMCL